MARLLLIVGSLLLVGGAHEHVTGTGTYRAVRDLSVKVVKGPKEVRALPLLPPLQL